MSRWLGIAAALVLAGCVNGGYRYADDGYWWQPPRESHLVVSVGWGGCAGGWQGPFGRPNYGYGYGYGNPYRHGWSTCGYGYGPGWYGAGLGYWRDPYWSQPWYLPPRSVEPLTAGARARQLANRPADETREMQRYEDLAPARRRDLGAGPAASNRSWGGGSYAPQQVPAPDAGIGAGRRGSNAVGYPSPPQSLGAGSLGSGSGSPGNSRSTGHPSANSAARSGAGGSAASSTAGASRSSSREARPED